MVEKQRRHRGNAVRRENSSSDRALRFTAKTSHVSPSLPLTFFPLLAVPVSQQVKQEVWDALLKRYGYKEVTDMLAMLHSASVIRRAITAMRRRKWTRNFARIDPELVEKADRLRRIQVFKRAIIEAQRECVLCIHTQEVGESDRRSVIVLVQPEHTLPSFVAIDLRAEQAVKQSQRYRSKV